MAAYDPKRPRPAELADDPPPVDALLETGEAHVAEDVPDDGVRLDEVAEAAGSNVAVPAETADAALPERPGIGERPGGGRAAAEVPVAPAPEVGTTNRAVLYASLGAAAVLVAVLILLRLRRRPSGSSSSS